MSNVRYIREADCEPSSKRLGNSDSHHVTCGRRVFPAPFKGWESDPDWGWIEYICEGKVYGNPASFKRWGWVVVYGKIVCPGCQAALLREGAPTKKKYSEWVKNALKLKAVTKPKPKAVTKRKPQPKVTETALAIPMPRFHLDLGD